MHHTLSHPLLVPVLFALFAPAIAQLTGPFVLYTVSSNATWNNRPLSTNPAQPWFIVNGQVPDPTKLNGNFFINTTGSNDLPRGFLTFNNSEPFPVQFGVIKVIDPSSTLQPISFIRQDQGLPNYSSSWTFGRNGQLVLTGLSRFFVQTLQQPFFNDAPVVWWQFGAGPVADPNAVEVTILRHDNVSPQLPRGKEGKKECPDKHGKETGHCKIV